jgi:hypothetical protein
MTRKPHRAINQRVVDPNQYMLKADHVKEIVERVDNHIRELLAEKEKQSIEARRLIEDQMRGYPEIFLTKSEYEKQHQGLVEDLKRIVTISATHVNREMFDPLVIAVNKLTDAKENTAKLIALSVSLTAVVVALIAGVSHALWGKIP